MSTTETNLAQSAATATGRTGGTSRTRAPRRDRPAPRVETLPHDPRRALRWVGLIDGLALLAMLGAVLVGFEPAWGGTSYLLPAVGGALLGLAVAWVGAWRRWPAVLVLALAIAAYLLFGGALALPGTTTAGVLPGGETIRMLATQSVQGWKQTVTTVPPLESFTDLAVIPYLLMFVVALVAGSIAWRARFAAWALLPLALGGAGVILLGTVQAALPVAQGLVAGIVALTWAGWRTTTRRLGVSQLITEDSAAARRRLWWHRMRTAAVMLVLGGVAAAFAGPVLLPDSPRTVLRETIVPPLELHEYVSPLMSFRKYAKDEAEEDLFTVRGLAEGDRLRLAVLDTYNGSVYDVSSGGAGGVFTRTGSHIDATAGTGVERSLDITIQKYAGVWIPDTGDVTGISWAGPRAQVLAAGTFYNNTTRTGIATAGLQSGDRYRLTALVPPVPTTTEIAKAQIADAAVPKVPADALPAALAAKAEQFMGAETNPVQRLLLLRDGLIASGVYSSGLEGQPQSLPGHSTARIDDLLAMKKMTGDDEQFAVALALMANQAGIPARVAMGFYPDEKNEWEPGEPFVVTGADVHAWVEVPFRDYGWVAIDAIPDEDNKIQTEPFKPKAPNPPVLEDPRPPEEPEQQEASSIADQPQPDQAGDPLNWQRIVVVVLSVTIPLLLVALPLIAIVAYKARRRARRRRAAQPVDRISGGWREVVDTARDLGTDVPSGATRREGARVIADAFGAQPVTLAHRADATVFGADDPTLDQVEVYWSQVDEAVTGMRASVSRSARLRASWSLRSIGRPRIRRTILARLRLLRRSPEGKP